MNTSTKMSILLGIAKYNSDMVEDYIDNELCSSDVALEEAEEIVEAIKEIAKEIELELSALYIFKNNDGSFFVSAMDRRADGYEIEKVIIKGEDFNDYEEETDEEE